MFMAVSGKRNRRAFTLIELLAVITIILILSALLAPPAATVMRGMTLTQAGQIVRDQLGYARQAALSRNRPVEVRFYQYGDPEVPGESAANPAGGKFRAMQLFEISESGNAAPLGKLQRLPVTVIVDSGDSLSALIAKSTVTPGNSLNYPLSTVGTNYYCVSFRFQPDGSTNLSPADTWFLTLHGSTEGDKLTGSNVPGNFITLQIIPANGQVKIYRPAI